MQNRYAGDVGDFGKLGLLRFVAWSNLRIGVNWYLVPDESHSADGKHTGYLRSKAFKGCDDELLSALGGIVTSAQRDVLSLEATRLIPSTKYYNATLYPPKTEGALTRAEWHRAALRELEGTDVVFLDPDNGLIVKSVGASSSKSIKYVLVEELRDYYHAGHSVIFYNHRCRQTEDDYLERFRRLKDDPAFQGAEWLGLTFFRGTTRDFFFILQPCHATMAREMTNRFLDSNWKQHSRRLGI